jgi:hypothetical protein
MNNWRRIGNPRLAHHRARSDATSCTEQAPVRGMNSFKPRVVTALTTVAAYPKRRSELSPVGTDRSFRAEGKTFWRRQVRDRMPSNYVALGAGNSRSRLGPALSARSRLAHNDEYGTSYPSNDHGDHARPGGVHRAQFLAFSTRRILGHPRPERDEARGDRLSMPGIGRRSPPARAGPFGYSGPRSSRPGGLMHACVWAEFEWAQSSVRGKIRPRFETRCWARFRSGECHGW